MYKFQTTISMCQTDAGGMVSADLAPGGGSAGEGVEIDENKLREPLECIRASSGPEIWMERSVEET